MSYHGDLEKKAAMEQKRNLAGDDPTNGNHHDDSGSGTNNNNSSSNNNNSNSNSTNNRRRVKKHPPEANPSRKSAPIPPAFLIKPVHGRMQCGTKKPLARGRPLKIPEAFLYKSPPPPPILRTGKTWSRASDARPPPPHPPYPPSAKDCCTPTADTDVSIPEAPVLGVQEDPYAARFGHCAHCWTDVNGVHLFATEQPIDRLVGGLLSEFIATTTPFQHLLIWM